MTEFKGSRTLSKKKYYELEQQLRDGLDDQQLDFVLTQIRTVLKFDPDVSVYNERIKDLIYQRRDRLKALGISTYESSGSKKSYHDRKNGKTA